MYFEGKPAKVLRHHALSVTIFDTDKFHLMFPVVYFNSWSIIPLYKAQIKQPCELWFKKYNAIIYVHKCLSNMACPLITWEHIHSWSKNQKITSSDIRFSTCCRNQLEGGQPKVPIDPNAHRHSHTQASKEAASAVEDARWDHGFKIHTINLCPSYVSCSMSKINGKVELGKPTQNPKPNSNDLDLNLTRHPK